ncbi:hypothetical protein EAE96_009354 [Botrytis aclada]|nr:hypothetical protein EAE96_009354 [Botrytis aclada]
MASLAHQIKIRQRDKRIYNFVLKQRRDRKEAALSVAREKSFYRFWSGSCDSIFKYYKYVFIPFSGLPSWRGSIPKLYEQNSSTFTPFGNLPAEIQLMIWEFASNKPTYMVYRYRTRQKELPQLSENQETQEPTRILERRPLSDGGMNYYNDSRGLLRVCHDSRTIAKKTRSQPYLTKNGNQVYINFALDIEFVANSGMPIIPFTPMPSYFEIDASF